MSVTSWPSEEHEISAEAVAAVFRQVTFGVLAAVAASIVLVVFLTGLGFSTVSRGGVLVAYLVVLSGAHILLRQAYMRDPNRMRLWRRWGRGFAVIGLLEGIGWGATSFALVSSGNHPAELLCLLVVAGVGSASIPAFGAYLPAFMAFILPTTIPFVVVNGLSRQLLPQGVAILMFLWVAAMCIFGFLFSRSFRRLVSLRLHAEKLAAKLGEQIEIAETANRAKSSFLAAASHDLRQPVHAVSLFIGALRGMPMSADAMLIIEQIEASSQAMDELFAALLDISRLDAGIVDVHERVFPIAPILERICRDYASEALDKGLKIIVHSSSSLLMSDPILVERVLRNLVSNAVRYTRKGRIVVGCRRKGHAVSVQVWDTGPGIPTDQRERIFQEYYQLGNAERDRAKGLGLGLAIVRRLTRILGCELTLRSHIDQGSCFEITLPLANEAAMENDIANVCEPLPLHAQMIVVIDDEASIRAAMSAVLERWGHKVLVAASAQEAVEKLAYYPAIPDLIISDFRLRNEETGLDVIDALRLEYNTEIPAILVTGDTAPERLTEARNSGLLLLHKPVSNGRLRAAITNVISEDQAKKIA